MSLDDLVDLTIDRTPTAPSRAGFGIPLFACYHTVSPELVIPCDSLDAVKDAGFAVTHPAYLAAQVAFSQNPRPKQFLIGKRTRVFTRAVKLTPINITQGFVYRFTVVAPDGTATLVEYVVPGAATATTISTALIAIIDPLAGVTAVAAGTGFTIGSAAGTIFDLKGLPNSRHISVLDNTANPGAGGIAGDLDDIATVDSTTWYGLAIDSNSAAEVAAVAAWTEARRKVFFANSTDSKVLDAADATDIGTTLQAASYARTVLLFSHGQIQAYSGLAWMAKQMPKDPGSSTYKFKTLNGVTVDSFTAAQIVGMRQKKVNFYQKVGGKFITEEGYTGAGEYIDIAVGVDWLYARSQEAVFGLMTATEKIPYTDKGAAAVVNVLNGVLETGVRVGFLSADPAPTITVPKVADIDPALRATRVFPDILGTATMAGAIHSVVAKITLNV